MKLYICIYWEESTFIRDLFLNFLNALGYKTGKL